MLTFALRQFRGRLRIASMAPISLKIVLDDGAVTRTLMFDTTTKVEQAHQIVREKIITIDPDKEYGFFLTSADNERSGIWLEGGRTLEYYMLRDGDSLYYLIKIRNLRLRMLDGSVKTLQVDESKTVENLMVHICDRIGIPNNEEYGLCREDSDVKEESKTSTGTLTLKKRTILREKDAKLEQLSKKLKTDDNVEWLDQNKTLRESQVDPKETLLFKRRLFYSDRNVDSRDPVQLNLLYVQTRDAILDGRQVVTEDKAAEFAGIQCQVQYGDFQEDKHKPGFIENLKEFLPEQYASSWGIEKKIIKEHRKHNGLSHIEAKHIYTKTARELPTYGVTFFLVKEKQKTKKKLVPRLLGINSESILRLDEETKEILQVWPLTQVKSYRAGSESFTLNFGDYSEKEYAVKTNEAFRIKDILQGYIDIIRKRLAAPYNVTHTDGEAMCEEMVEMSRGTMTQNVVASKVQTHSLVGPSQIISVDQGRHSQMGTKIVTVHQVITSRQGDRSQQPMKGELNRSSSIPHDFDRKLNRLNSESVRTVVLLSDPTKENIAEVRNIVNGFKENLPSLLKGANERAANLKGETSKKLLEELDELCAYINALITTTMKSDLTDPDNLMTAQDSAKKIADLSTQMFFSLDPKSKRRSQLLRSSRNSFILDEKTEACLRRASFITATDNACQAVKHAKDEICEMSNGPPLSDEEQKTLQLKIVDKMGKLNAAIALLLNAHADEKNVDYEMAVNSMKTIDELLPGFIKDSKSLMSNGNESTNKKLRGQIIELLDGARNMCMLTGSNDVNKMHDVGNAYADVSRKLIYTFNRPDQHAPDTNDVTALENQILAIAKDVGNKVSLLLTQADELNNLESKDPHSENLDAAGAKCADATQGLLACAKLTAPTIHEPHCQSALTAAAENLSSSAQNLALAYKPLVDKPGRHGFASQLADRVFDLAKSLDKLKGTYTNLRAKNNDIADTDESELQQKQRLQFIVTSSAAKNGLVDADKELKEIIRMEPNNTTKTPNPDAKRLLSQKMAQLNAAIASLLQATSDADKPDYDTAVTAVDSICQLTPSIINDTKAIHGDVDDKSWQEITENLKDLLQATRGLCASAEDCNIADLNEAASKIGTSSGKLTFIFNPRRNTKKEDDVKKLSTFAVDQASQLLAKVDQLAKRVGGDEGTKLDTAGVQVVDAAKQLLKTAEISAPSIDDARCQAVLLSATDRLSDRIRTMEDCWKPLIQTAEYRQCGELINHDLNQVNLAIDKLKEACLADSGDVFDNPLIKESEGQEKERLKFVVSSSEAKNALIDADKKILDMLRTPPTPNKNATAKTPNARRILYNKMAQLNAAIASLIQATSDAENPDYQAAGAAVNTICQLTPNIINDAKVLHGNVDDNSWQEITDNLQRMLEATRGLCSNAEDCNIAELNEAASKIANSSGKLTFIFNPRRNTKKEDDVVQLSRSAVGETSQLLAKVNQLANSVGGDEGTNLDTAGVQVVDAAQQLLKTAEITAPSMDDARCQAVLLSATDRLSDRIRTMEDCWKPLLHTAEYRQSGELIDRDLKQVNLTLDKLKEACQADTGDIFDTPNNKSEAQQKERLNFVASTSEAKNALMDADKKMQVALRTPPIPNKSTTAKTPNARRILSDKMAQLNAALASLVQATSDAENPDYQAAGAAVNTICQLTPNIINDAKVLHGNVDDNSWQEITENLQRMLEATRGLCSNAEDCNIAELNVAASKIANSSGKLTFIFNPRRNAKKEDDVLKLSRSAVDETSKLLAKVDQLANSVGGDEGTKLDTAGVQVVDAAQQLLKTAEVTAPSMDDARCQAVLLSAIDRLSNRTKTMEKSWKPLVQAPEYCQSAELLSHGLKEVDIALDKLKKACQADAGQYQSGFIENESRENDEKARIQFMKTLKAAKSAMVDSAKDIKNADLLINKMSVKQIKNNHIPVNYLLYQKLAKMNAALATLLQATSDREKPDYDEAARAISTISSLTPDIIKDVKPLQSTVDDKSWRNITDNLKSIVDTTCDICDNVDNPQVLKESASKFANSVSKLTYVFNPRNNQKNENQILDLSRDAVEQMSLLLSNVYQLAEGVDGDDGEKLDKAGVSVVDSAQMLLKIAEITSPNINDEHCKTALLSSINQVSNLAEDLKTAWKPLAQTPKHRLIGDQLDQNHKIVQTTLDKLRTACQETEDLEETKPYQLSNLSEAKNKIKDSEKLFSEDKGYEQRAIQTGEDKNIATADKPVSERRIQLSQKLAQLNEAVAILLQAMLDRENPDCGSAEQAINIIANLTPDIVQETISLQGNMDDNSREVLFKEAKELCSASQEICSSVENNNLEELNRAATKYAQSSGKIHFIVSPRSYPNKEKKILDISRSACERTSLMLSRVSRLAESVEGDEGENLNISGTRVADSAQGLLSTAQVTAPSTSDRNCQSALASSADTLSDVAQDLANIWKPLISNPKTKQIGEQLDRDLNLLKNDLAVLKETCQDNTDYDKALDIPQQETIQDLKKEGISNTKNNMQNIDMLLEDIYKSTKDEIKQNPLIIEDTPLRQLATKIMESAKAKSESSKYSADERKRFADFANKLAAAINKLDIANARCRETSFSSREKKERALQLENAILNLQIICIQSRQKDGEASNIVNLTEFVDDVTSAVDDLHNTTKGIKQEHEKEAIMEINNKCQKIQEGALKLMNPQTTNEEGNMLDDILQIDQFAKDCDDQVKLINEKIPKIDDENARQIVKNKVHLIEERCNLLSFAAKSSISNAESATLEESLRNLEDVEKKIDVIIKSDEGTHKQETQNVITGNNKQIVQATQSSLATAIAAGNENKLPKALAYYATQMKSLNQTTGRNNKLKEHLDRLLDTLKMQITAKNRRVVTWQDANDEEVTKITEKILQELESYAHDIQDDVQADKEVPKINDGVQILNEYDVKRLLKPNTTTAQGDEKELRAKFNQQIQKLNSMTGTTMLSSGKPETLARSLHLTADAAAHLSRIARGLKTQDPVTNKRIDEAVQEMNIATYKLLKTSESVCHISKHPDSRRRLIEAFSLLNDSLNNLARAAVPGDKMQRDCSELSRSLQLQQSFLTTENPSCSLSYADCIDAIQNQQDVINKLKSEQPMSRTECGSALRYVSSAICNSAEYASQTAYLLTLSKDDQNAAKQGLVDVPFIKKLSESIKENCVRIICNGDAEVTNEKTALNKQVQQLQEAINNASPKISVQDNKELMGYSGKLQEALKNLNKALQSNTFEANTDKVTPAAMKVIDAINEINNRIDNLPQPKTDMDQKATANSKEVLDTTRNLMSKTSVMIRKASSCEKEEMTWFMFGSSDVTAAFESLLLCIREKGAEAGLIESLQTSEELNAPVKSYVETQIQSSMSWLRKPTSNDTVKANGVKGAENIVNMAEQMYEDLHGGDKEEMKQIIGETKQLLKDCVVKYQKEKASLLMERLRELRKMLERAVVTRVVEDFLDEEPLANVETTVYKENDEKKRKFLLERKIAELLAQLGRVTKTARFVADTGNAPRQELMKTSDQVELLAPSLVKAAQQRIQTPDDKVAIEHYQKLLAEYADSLSRVRDLCDKAVDPIEFSQAAGETMQRIKEESNNDPQKSLESPKVILKLCKRVVDVGMHSDLVRNDPELKKTLLDIKTAVETKPDTARADWRDVTAEIMRRTGQVESVLGGENIFLKQPEPDQPIYAAALDLHSAVRGWSARDNEIVAVAKRTAVLMAKLSEYMNTGNKRELIFTSNSIVAESRQVAELAKKLALECSDIRIRTNLLQVCDRIPTISGQLKMLTTVKSSSLGHQGSVEDQEAMNMLVGNAQNLMISIQEVVKAAASASVKIASQRGCRIKWVQRSYY